MFGRKSENIKVIWQFQNMKLGKQNFDDSKKLHWKIKIPLKATLNFWGGVYRPFAISFCQNCSSSTKPAHWVQHISAIILLIVDELAPISCSFCWSGFCKCSVKNNYLVFWNTSVKPEPMLESRSWPTFFIYATSGFIESISIAKRLKISDIESN